VMKILIAEDDPEIQTLLKWGLANEYAVLQAFDKTSAMQLFNSNLPPVVTLDLGLPPTSNDTREGLSCLHEMLKKAPETKVIVVTGNNERKNALTAIQMGAYDYYLKPIILNELKTIIKRASYLSEIESENRKLNILLNKDIGFEGMIGQSPKMQRIFETIKRVATTDVSVVVTGESGTGKELVAKAIHTRSLRSKGPFVPINCGAIPENLLESELFGYEKGSFTNAYTKRIGKCECADKGTLFLDEIGEMSTNLQVKLLRFLQERNIQRIGGTEDIEIDTRVIGATNIDLEDAVKKGRFREDLFFRLNVMLIEVPPLRERGSDIKLLANYFFERYNLVFKKKIGGFSRSALNAIEQYHWPGNVRELENRIQKSMITTDSNLIEAHSLGFEEGQKTQYEGITIKEARKKIEIELIERAVERHQGNIKLASEELGISRPTMYDLINKYKLFFNTARLK
jgi:two-component system NtrC family response regulator